MIDKTFKDTKKTILYTLGVFLIFSLGYFLITLVIQINADTAQKNKLLAQQQQLVAVEKTIIS
ncbi:MAG TPA: hypothetical protein DCY58_00205, partial [Acetobacterium sp.]|nr:hypothetical protein [Acetobacterium sp.]